VLTGELRECSWEALKAVYFTGSTEQACVNIGIFAEQRRIGQWWRTENTRLSPLV
jgi:hypothetical protein